MTSKIVSTTGILMVMALCLSCSTKPADNSVSKLTFVIDDISQEEWSHFDDGSFEVLHTVTARITAPDDLRGRIVAVRINALAATDTEATIGTKWSVSLPNAKPNDDQLQSLIHQRITRSSLPR
jgi:hypothetical protein